MKLSRRELAVLRIEPNTSDGLITLRMVRAAGVKATIVCDRLREKGLLRRGWPLDGDEFGWSLTSEGKAILRMLEEKRTCDWCDARAGDYADVNGSATTVYFCDDHERVGHESAKGASSAIGGRNVAKEVFGMRLSNRALREAAAK